MLGLLKVFFSNRIESLYQRLKTVSFEKTSPFLTRILVVPNPAVKAWVMLQFAKDPEMRVAAGFKVVYLEEAFEELYRLLLEDSRESSFQKNPSLLELSLAIEVEMRKTVDNFSHLTKQEQKLWQPLMQYFQSSEQSFFSRKSEKRLIALSDQLARLFQKYGLYGESMVQQWETSSSFSHWQQKLWTQLFTAAGPWSYPTRRFNDIRTMFASKKSPLQNVHVHFFALSFLPLSQHKLLTQLADYLPIHYFLLSPSRVFWSDISSDWESQFLQKRGIEAGLSEAKQMALEELLCDRNPLLANLGRLGRVMATQIEESHCLTEENYEIHLEASEIPHYRDLLDAEVDLRKPSGPFSLLDAVQSDLLLLRNPANGSTIDFSEKDDSIQVHVASSKMREVEILYNTLLGMIHDRAQLSDLLCPEEILVMAPDIMDYEAYIKAVFGHQESRLNFQLMDLRVATQSSLVQGFLYLLNLSSGRWDINSLLQLFEFPEFQKKHQFSNEELQFFRQWVKEAGIKWGENLKHRNDLLKRDHCHQTMVEETAVGTWDYGLSRLLLGLTMVLEDRQLQFSEDLHTLPVEGIELTQGELLGKFIQLLKSLREDLLPLEQEISLSLKDWTNYLECLCNAYFLKEFEEESSQGDLGILKQHLNALEQVPEYLQEAKFKYSSIKKHLDSLLDRGTLCFKENHLQAIRFCSMLPMRAIPAKVICLLGMKEGAFPKRESFSSLNLLPLDQKADYCPSSTDYDRFLFLETLLSSRMAVILSYPCEDEETLPSILITELMNYLDSAYTIQKKKVSDVCTIHHPFYSFDYRYFGKRLEENHSEAFLRNYFFKDYLAAQAYYDSKKLQPHRFVPESSWGDQTMETSYHEQTLLMIDFKKISESFRNPLKTYFNNALGMFIQLDKYQELKSDEPFSLSILEHASLRKTSLSTPLDLVLKKAEKKGLLPLGMFKHLSQEQLHLEVEEIQKNLKTMGVSSADFMTVEFHHHCQEPYQKDKATWVVPAVQINCENNLRVKIAGTLSQVTPQGLVIHGKNQPEDIIKAWPQYLMFCHLRSFSPFSSLAPQILLTRCDQPKTLLIGDCEVRIKGCLDHYFYSLKNISPLLPEWVPDLLEGDYQKFSDKVALSLKDNFHPTYNDYLRWLFVQGDFLITSGTFEKWKNQAEMLHGDVIRGLFPKKTKGVKDGH